MTTPSRPEADKLPTETKELPAKNPSEIESMQGRWRAMTRAKQDAFLRGNSLSRTRLRTFWWEALPAVPRDRNSHAYRRLKRSWFDHTCPGHPFLSEHCENHLTATFFENFVLFDPNDWIGMLTKAAGIPPIPHEILQCNWGYEAQDSKTAKMADVGIHARTAAGDWAVLVEAKARGGPLKKTDVNPDSYLELAEFSEIENRCLIYLVDEQDAANTRAIITDDKNRSGVLTWQALGGIQIELALKLRCDPQIRDFVAGSIQYQYLSHDIRPTRLVADYLAGEPTRGDISAHNPDRMKSWRTDWKINDAMIV